MNTYDSQTVCSSLNKELNTMLGVSDDCLIYTVDLPKIFACISFSLSECNYYRKIKSEINSQEYRKQNPPITPLGQEETC